MLPDWVLLILLFIGIAIMPGYESAKMLTPWEYVANGVGTVVESSEFLHDDGGYDVSMETMIMAVDTHAY